MAIRFWAAGHIVKC
ncbi:MAG: hypothetical protein ACYC2Y_08530, partial [Armatimonadota bacterium]